MFKRNFFKSFINKINNLPDWLKVAVYNELSNSLKNSGEYSYKLTSFKPTLTFKGKEEVENKSCGFDSNIYNFLLSCQNNLSMSEFMLNTFMSMQEVTRILNFCIQNKFVENITDKELLHTIEYISGKSRTGEYLVSIDKINSNDLTSALNLQNEDSDLKIGECLTKVGALTKEEIGSILQMKNNFSQRFVLDSEDIPKVSEICDQEELYKREISKLSSENKILKNKLEQLLLLVSSNE